jgi:hypothetical protein
MEMEIKYEQDKCPIKQDAELEFSHKLPKLHLL